MNISLLFLIVELASHKQITNILKIVIWHAKDTPNNHPYLKLSSIFLTNIKTPIKGNLLIGNQVHPKSQQPLRYFSIFAHNVMGFDGIVGWVEIGLHTIFHINRHTSNAFIFFDGVIIPNFNIDNGVDGKLQDQVNFLEILRIRVILNIIV